MSTINQIIKTTYSMYPENKLKLKRSVLACCPQKKAVYIKSFEMSPKKPNLTKRKVVRMRISFTGKLVTCYVSG